MPVFNHAAGVIPFASPEDPSDFAPRISFRVVDPRDRKSYVFDITQVSKVYWNDEWGIGL